jgi:hypothetical protein
MGSVPRIHLGIASGILAVVRNVGMVLGIALAGAVLYNVAPNAVSRHPGSFDSSEMQVFLAGFRWAYLSGAIMAGIAVLTSFAAVERRRQD